MGEPREPENGEKEDDGMAHRPEDFGEKPDAPSAVHGDFHSRKEDDR